MRLGRVLLVGREKLAKFIKARIGIRAFVRMGTRCRQPRVVWPGRCPPPLPYRQLSSGNRIVFNIGGNNFRLVVVAYYSGKALVVDRIGTHAEYDKWKL